MTTLLALALLVQAGIGPAQTPGSACARPAASRVSGTGLQDAQEVLEGNLEVIIEDSSGGSRTLYFLITGRDRIPLRFVTAPRNLRTGTRVRARGNYEDGGRFVVVSLERVVPAG